jgi:thiol-disulfide isomerase/thioredoxin
LFSAKIYKEYVLNKTLFPPGRLLLLALLVFIQCAPAKAPAQPSRDAAPALQPASGSAATGQAASGTTASGAEGPTSAEGPGEAALAFAEAGLPVLKRRIPAVDFSAPLAAPLAVPLAAARSSVRLEDLRGKVVFLNFWAAWCGPCRAEMASMEALYQRFKEKGLEIVAVNYGEDQATVAAFFEQSRLSFPAALDQGGRVNNTYGVQALPTTYIIDREGYIITRVVGSLSWDTPELQRAFAALLEKQ